METEGICPGDTWEMVSPGRVGLVITGLDAFATSLGGRGCIVRHGYMAYTWSEASKRGDIASAAKPLYTHFLFKL